MPRTPGRRAPAGAARAGGHPSRFSASTTAAMPRPLETWALPWACAGDTSPHGSESRTRGGGRAEAVFVPWAVTSGQNKNAGVHAHPPRVSWAPALNALASRNIQDQLCLAVRAVHMQITGLCVEGDPHQASVPSTDRASEPSILYDQCITFFCCLQDASSFFVSYSTIFQDCNTNLKRFRTGPHGPLLLLDIPCIPILPKLIRFVVAPLAPRPLRDRNLSADIPPLLRRRQFFN